MSRLRGANASLQAKLTELKNRFTAPPRNDGKKLEEQVASLLRKEGFRDVQLNTRVKDANGNWSEIDVIGKNRSLINRFFTIPAYLPYGARQIFVECKQYNPDLRVSLGDVSKFKEVLQLNKININQGLFVTTSTYVPRAGTIGIRTVDGSQLKRWNRKHRVESQAYTSFKNSVRMITVFAVLWVVYIATIELREARTKTTPQNADSYEDVEAYKKYVQQFGNNGFCVTTGQNLSTRFPILSTCYNAMHYAYQYGLYTAQGKDTSKIPAPIIHPLSTDPYAKKPAATPPKVGDIYLSYELHQPLPLSENSRNEALGFVRNYNRKTNDNTWIPQSLWDFYHTQRAQNDFLVINTILPSDAARFMLSNLSNEYLTIDKNGTALFKLPIKHYLSIPGYFLPTMQFRYKQCAALLSEFTQGLDDAINNTTQNLKHIHDKKVENSFETTTISSGGNLALQSNREPHEVYAATEPFKMVTSDSSYGDTYFDYNSEQDYDPIFGSDDQGDYYDDDE